MFLLLQSLCLDGAVGGNLCGGGDAGSCLNVCCCGERFPDFGKGSGVTWPFLDRFRRVDSWLESEVVTEGLRMEADVVEMVLALGPPRVARAKAPDMERAGFWTAMIWPRSLAESTCWPSYMKKRSILVFCL